MKLHEGALVFKGAFEYLYLGITFYKKGFILVEINNKIVEL